MHVELANLRRETPQAASPNYTNKSRFNLESQLADFLKGHFLYQPKFSNNFMGLQEVFTHIIQLRNYYGDRQFLLAIIFNYIKDSGVYILESILSELIRL